MLKIINKRTNLIVLVTLFTLISCGAGSVAIRNTETVANISKFKDKAIENIETAEKVINEYSVEFEIPNPFTGGSPTYRRIDPNHEDKIICRATLLDCISSEADILYQCSRDSLSVEECELFTKNYRDEKIRDGMFRIRVSMESGFSPKSMDPKHWVIYIENSKGTVIEPDDIVLSPVTTIEDSIYSKYHRINLPRKLLKRSFELYFKRTTFFGEDLLSTNNPYIVLVFNREKRTLSRVAWKISPEPVKK